MAKRDDHSTANNDVALFLDAFSHLYKRVCPSFRPSVRPSVGHARVEIMKNRLFSPFNGKSRYVTWK